jgi:hypothetical protein
MPVLMETSDIIFTIGVGASISTIMLLRGRSSFKEKQHETFASNNSHHLLCPTDLFIVH